MPTSIIPTGCFPGNKVLLVITIPLVINLAYLLYKRRYKKGSKKLELGSELRRHEFDLEEDFAFCNSGGKPCVPLRLLARQTELIRQRERNTQLWTYLREPRLIWESLLVLADYIGADVANLTLIENATEGTSTVLRNQKYKSGDKILLCREHAYNAVVRQAEVVVEVNPGVDILYFDLPYPVRCTDDIVSAYAKVLTENHDIKITVLDHISSHTTVLFPIKDIIQLCRSHDVITVVDGAHAAGQIPLTVDEYGADYYVGNLCKWLMVPQHVGFLWVHPSRQAETRPLNVSHSIFNPHFRNRFYPPLTLDRISHILVKDALEFQKELGGLELLVARNSQLLDRACAMLSEAWGTPLLEVAEECRSPLMACVGLPPDLAKAYPETHLNTLHGEFHMRGVAFRVTMYLEKYYCRLSCNVWNDWSDFEKVRDVVLQLVEESRENPLTGRPSPAYFYPGPISEVAAI